MLTKINRKEQLYVISEGTGYSCLGFEVLNKRALALAKELGYEWNQKLGTLEAYSAYDALVNEAKKRNDETGWRAKSELTPELIGLEGKRIEVIDSYGSRRRFYVGKSTGFIPCHLEIARRNSSGGIAVMGAPFKSIRVIGSK